MGDRADELPTDEREALLAAFDRRLDDVRQSAQYRVGDLLISSLRSPRRLLRLPVDGWRLARELRAARQPRPLPTPCADPARPIVAATVLDTFSHQAFDPEWTQRPLPRDGVAELRTARPDLLFVESAWEGNGGAFRYDLSHFAKRPRSTLRRALQAAGDADIPRIFWNKEDPVHFDTFADAARAFDWIFTTDADCIDRYRRLAGHDRVAALPFAAQPRIHNPLGAPATRLPRACFAGSWQAENFAARGSNLELLLKPALDAGVLDIFDRMAAPDATGVPFPEPYRRAVLGHRPYSELLDEYRRYACFLNVNSVTTSPTMCARRVFELLACGTPVISTPSRAIDELFGDTVITVDSATATTAAIEQLLGDDDHRARVAHRGYRLVMSQHTYSHRVDTILEQLGIAPATQPPSVTVIARVESAGQVGRLSELIEQQVDVTVERVVTIGAAEYAGHSIAGRVPVVILPGTTSGAELNRALDAVDTRFVAFVDADADYGPHYLHDALLVHRFADAAVVGKRPDLEFVSTDAVDPATVLIDRQVWPTARFGESPDHEFTDLFAAATDAGHVIVATDRFNYAHTADV